MFQKGARPLAATRRWVPRAWTLVLALSGAAAAAQTTSATAELSADETELFESKIRPVLVAHCYECHNGVDRAESELVVDHRDGLLVGGRRGPAVVPGDPRGSLLLRSLRHPSPALRMPLDRDPLPEAVIADFERWIESGAPDPRDASPAGAGATASTSWDEVFEDRRAWWSFQPIGSPSPPDVDESEWRDHTVDRFLRAAMATAELRPAALADPAAVLRRLSFTLTGLPPTPTETSRFVERSAIDRQAAVEEAADRLIASPHFGERWARHWMDWVRYAESHGSEGDIGIPYAWRYRDYLIRALNADVPYDWLVREHIAGDKLAAPRIDAERGINESAIGTAQYRFVLHGYSPTDALAEQVRFTDNQIDVLSKAFLGLTVSCARCHDHKFDAVSQEDFYALYGVMASARPATLTIDSPDRAQTGVGELRELKHRLRELLAAEWLEAADSVGSSLLDEDEDRRKLLDEEMSAIHPLRPWARLDGETGLSFARIWDELSDDWQESRRTLAARDADYPLAWRLGTDADADEWFRHGNGLDRGASPAGEFHVAAHGERIVDDILPAGIYSHSLSTKHSAVLSSPRFTVEPGELYLRMAGDGDALARYAVQNYPSYGETYPYVRLQGGEAAWQRWDVSYWEGDHVYFELSTAADQPILIRDRERSWFGVTDALFVPDGTPAPKDEIAEFLDPLFAQPGRPRSREDLARRYVAALRTAIEAWRAGTMSDAQARFVGGFVRADLLPNRLDALPEAAALVEKYRRIEAGIPVPIRAPGVIDGTSFDQPLFEGGNHTRPTADVPRRFLSAIDDELYPTDDSGRLALAESLLDPANPFTARVIVNRLWHHVFGRGLVATTDNFGSLGEKPSHPELLDHLATRFTDGGWSIKKILRFLTTTRAFQLETRPTAGTAEVDPANRLLSHANLRRLEAESIRDAILMSAGVLDPALYGEPVDGEVPRRSVYVQVRRNSMDPFLTAFDAPQPVSTAGRRSVTNVPAQALALLNHPFVLHHARTLGQRVAGDPSLADDRQRLVRLFQLTLGREPGMNELETFESFLGTTRAALQEDRTAAVDHLADAIPRREEEIATVWNASRARLVHYVTVEAPDDEKRVAPVADWDFDGSANDGIGSLHATLEGKARIENGEDGTHVLRLTGAGDAATTPPIERDLTEHSLELWVELEPGDETGTLMALLGPDGQEIDSLSFTARGDGEEPAWRVRGTVPTKGKGPTHPTPGAADEAADPDKKGGGKDDYKGGGSEREAPVDGPDVHHLVVSAHTDGDLILHVDGELAGRLETGEAAAAIRAGTARVRFGGDGEEGFRGRLLRARLYNRALSTAEIEASSFRMVEFVPDTRIAVWLGKGSRGTIDRLESEIDQLLLRATSLDEWSEVAHAIFNLKEFLYLR